MTLCEKFDYSRHAEDRLRERKITKEYVQSGFRNGCATTKQANGSYKCLCNLRGRTLTVIVKVVKGKQCFVLTAYWANNSLN